MFKVNTFCILFFIFLALVPGCRVIKEIPVEHRIEYEYRDSLRIKDSTVINPKERYVDVVRDYDTLKLETSMAAARAYVDTSLHMLKGEIKNKQGVQYKYVYKDKIVYRDSLVYKDVLVEVEKVVKTHFKYEKWLWAYLIISLLAIGICIYRKFFLPLS